MPKQGSTVPDGEQITWLVCIGENGEAEMGGDAGVWDRAGERRNTGLDRDSFQIETGLSLLTQDSTPSQGHTAELVLKAQAQYQPTANEGSMPKLP